MLRTHDPKKGIVLLRRKLKFAAPRLLDETFGLAFRICNRPVVDAKSVS
jgi:hypothetical protein